MTIMSAKLTVTKPPVLGPLRERDIIIGLTSTACRLIGLCLRDHNEAHIDEAIPHVSAAIRGLEKFGALAGSDSGSEYTTIALRQIVLWMQRRDIESARRAFEERYQTSDEEFVASMDRAWEDIGSRRGPLPIGHTAYTMP
jgi:hypothetical protein